jgi:transcription elongation factor GreA
MGEHMTPVQHERLAAELTELEGPARAGMVEAIKLARGHGDLSENFEYHAAKDEQALLERRIAILRSRLEEAVIVEIAAAGVVAVGARIVIEDDEGVRLQAEISNMGGEDDISTSSPLGTVLLGKRVGDVVTVRAPRRTWRARILEIHVNEPPTI